MTLSTRVEQAGEGSRELDAAIWYAAIEKPKPGDKLDRDMIDRWPHYTTSLDAAMTLVPEGIYPTIDFTTDRVWLRTGNGFDLPSGCAYGFAATVPLSICAAALKARGL